MSKKKRKNLDAQMTLQEEAKQDEISQGTIATSDAKSNKNVAKNQDLKDSSKTSKDKNKKDNKKDSKKDKKKEKKGGIVKKTKETVSELKKVTWPSFGEVVKKTGVVIAFVVIFGLFLFGLNYLLGGLVNLLINGTWM